MEKETVIIRLRASIDFEQDAKTWLNRIANIAEEQNSDNGIWFAREGGKYFLSEFQGSWRQALTEETDQTIQSYFKELGFNQNLLPKTKITETYSGSWVMEAAVTIASSIGGTYALIKGVSEIPDMIEGLTKLKDRIANRFHRRVDREAGELLREQVMRKNLPSPPPHVMHMNDFVLDARPLASLKPSEMKSHAIHLQAAVSQDAFSLENLGNEVMRDIQIGLFVGKNRRHNWSFADAYTSSVSILSPKQTINKDIGDFMHTTDKLKITDLPVHIDCWVQDAFGIYLFNFYLDRQ
jgi:hypothetical protein